MKALLTTLGELLARKAPHQHSTLLPGTSDFGPLTARLPVPLHPDLVTLWEWHDGIDHHVPSPFEIAPSCTFMDVDSAARTWDQQQAIREAYPYAPWRPEWVPIGSDGSGGLLVVDHTPASAFRVFEAFAEAGEFVHVVAESPRAMITDLVTRLRDDVPAEPVKRYDRRYPFA
ncbi:SMI1/KNR4 family protein [Streptomyces sp. ID05-26A]|nr:SMI1/KNR4 family protein [Streptomyces sp. ID05-26A]